MTAQSYEQKDKNVMEAAKNDSFTHNISSGRSEKNRFCGANLITSDTFCRDFPLHEFLVGPEVNTITGCFTPECYDLTFVKTGNPVTTINLLDGVPGTSISRVGCRLCLKSFQTV